MKLDNLKTILTTLSLILSLAIFVYIFIVLSNGNEKFNQDCGNLCTAIMVAIIVLNVFKIIVFQFLENPKIFSIYLGICVIIFLVAIFLIIDGGINNVISFMELGGYKNEINTVVLLESDVDMREYLLVRIMPIILILCILEIISTVLHLDEYFNNSEKRENKPQT